MRALHASANASFNRDGGATLPPVDLPGGNTNNAFDTGTSRRRAVVGRRRRARVGAQVRPPWS
jgi:hypothetical protein